MRLFTMVFTRTNDLLLRISRNTICLQQNKRCFRTQDISKVGFIGLGAMGSRMAKNLLKEYKDVTVFDVNEVAVSGLVQEGAKVAEQLSDLNTADCIISMLPANQHVLDVYQGPDGLISQVRPNTLLIDSSTVDPDVPQSLAAEAEKRGVVFIDAPVSGGVIAAANAQLTFMVGGSAEGARRSEPVLRSMSRHIVHCGPVGSGQIAKICNNMLLGICMIGTSEAMNLGIRLGMNPKLLAEIINLSSGRSWSSDTYNPVPGVMPNVPATNQYQGGFKSQLIVKDLNLAALVAERNGISVPFGKKALEVYNAVCDDDKAELDFSVVYQYIKEIKSS